MDYLRREAQVMRSFRLLAVALLAIVVLSTMSSVAHALSPVDICVIQLGLLDQNEIILWLPGFGWAGLPPSQCEDRIEVLGVNVLDWTIVLHQFNLTISAIPE